MAEIDQAAVAHQDGSVTYRGVTYEQVDIKKCGPSKSDQCYWCCAYRSMALCDQICGHCNIGHVFVRKIQRGSSSEY